MKAIQIIAQYFQTSYGPYGLDKLLYDKFNNDLLVSNDGGIILHELIEHMEYKLSKFIFRWGKSLKDIYSDGIKSFYIILSEMLKTSADLFNQGVPRGSILDAISVLKSEWNEFCDSDDLKIQLNLMENHDFIKQYLLSTISGKLSSNNAEHLVEIAIQACKLLGNYILSPMFRAEKFFQRVFVPGSLIKDSQIMDGVLIGKEPVNLSILPNQGLKNPRIMIIREKLYTDLPDEGETSPSGFEFDFKIDNPENLKNLQKTLKDRSNIIFEKINQFKPNIIITHKGVDRNLENFLNSNNIILVRRAKSEEIEYLAQFLEVEIVDNIKNITENNVAIADSLIYEKIGRDMQIIIKKKKNYSDIQKKNNNTKNNKTNQNFRIPSIGTIVIGGSLWVVCEEVERLFLKLIKTFTNLKKDNKILYGGGNTELKFIHFVKKRIFLKNLKPKVAYCLEYLTNSFKILPFLLIQNSGIEPTAMLNKINSELYKDNPTIGFNSKNKSMADMLDEGIYENFSLKLFQYELLFEALTQLLRIDTILVKKKITESN